jgi:2'-5' RNA ligase
MAELFSTFDEAWAWFLRGGHLVAIEDQRERFLRGRAQFLSLQAPIAEMPAAQAIADLQNELTDIEGLSLMPPEILHISVRGVGFQVIAKSLAGDVLRQSVGGIGERARSALKGVAPIDIEIGPLNVFPDALVLEVHPVEALREVLRRLDVVAEPDAFPYSADNYLPHVTIGTFLDPSVATALREHLPASRDAAPIHDRVRRIDFVRWWFTGDDVTAWPELNVIRSYRLT